MGIDDIISKITPDDAPILEIPEQLQLQVFMRKVIEDISFDEISQLTGIDKERLLDINNEISIHFRDNLASKVLPKALLGANKDDNEMFKQFFIRPDVDLCCNFLFKITDVKKNLRNLNTPTFIFLKDNWEKYRGY